MLSGGEDSACVLKTAGGVEETKEHALGAGTEEIVEIARHPLVVVHGCQFGPVQFGDVRVDWIVNGNSQRFSEMGERTHRNQAVKLPQTSDIK
jgi:hypothetical protein